MDWGSYILGAGTVLVSLFVGFAMGNVSSKRDDTHHSPVTDPRDLDKGK